MLQDTKHDYANNTDNTLDTDTTCANDSINLSGYHNLDNCNEVNSRLPHRAHISKVSCCVAICS